MLDHSKLSQLIVKSAHLWWWGRARVREMRVFLDLHEIYTHFTIPKCIYYVNPGTVAENKRI